MTGTSSNFSDSHELLYFVETRLVGGDPRAIFTMLHEHLEFLSDLDAQGKLVFAGPLDTPAGTNSGNGIYALRATSMAEARAIVDRDPLHRARIRAPQIWPWHRKKDWSVLPDRSGDWA
jgi:uncharacterized protein YciI